MAIRPPQQQRPMGRPTSLHDPTERVVRTPDGERTLTVAEAIITDLATGAAIKQSVERVVPMQTYRRWMRDGIRLILNPPSGRTLTEYEDQVTDFCYRAMRAEAEGAQRMYGVVAADALQPQVTTRREYEVDKDGERKLVREVEETKPPNAQSARWLLQHRWPKEYGNRDSLEISAADEDRPIDETAAIVLEKWREWQEQRRTVEAAQQPAALEAEAREVTREGETDG